MKKNRNVALRGLLSVLVPYRRYHVEKYHQWMESEELRRLTASERLTLDEEYEMQRQWQRDEDKCTFIILSRSLIDAGAVETDAMVGDVNLFLNVVCDESDPEVDVDQDPDEKRSIASAELEIMVAEKAYRRRGIGKEAASLMMVFAVQVLGIRRFYVKIESDNLPSIRMFGRLGFQLISKDQYFDEYLMRLDLLPTVAKAMALRHDYQSIDGYPPDDSPHPSDKSGEAAD